MSQPRFTHTIDQVAEALGVTRTAIIEASEGDEIPYQFDGNSWRYDIRSVYAWLERLNSQRLTTMERLKTRAVIALSRGEGSYDDIMAIQRIERALNEGMTRVRELAAKVPELGAGKVPRQPASRATNRDVARLRVRRQALEAKR